jgi:hypothetical protein
VNIVTHSSIDRIKQSKFDKVYLSGERDFAVSNAKAGGEWYEDIVNTALGILHDDFYTLVGEYAKRSKYLEKAIEKQSEKMTKMLEEPDDEKRDVERQVSRDLERRYYDLQKEKEEVLGGRRQKLKKQNDDIVRKRFGDEAVIFTVVMPYSVFVSKMASPHSKERISLFEEMYAGFLRGEKRNWFDYIGGKRDMVWEFFQEVHLSGVEPRFIKKWELMK